MHEAGCDLLRSVERLLLPKHYAELRYWRKLFESQGRRFGNAFYERLMLGMAGQGSPDFLEGKIVADFGCGPQGSLAWATPARVRIGIDVLAAKYADAFPIAEHRMIYVTSTEQTIPLPDDLVDVMFTLNAIDHVRDFDSMCAEILRVIAPGGLFVGSFNIGHAATATEPQRLTAERVRRHLLDHLTVEEYRLAGLPDDRQRLYEQFIDGPPTPYRPGRAGVLWARARKHAP